jgi:hypothetical protein
MARMDKSSIEFDKVYLVMALRIKLGWSDRDLSFLLGYRALYVEDVEDPNGTLRYSPTDTNYLRRIFFNCKLSAIMSPKIPERYYKVEISTEDVTPVSDENFKHSGQKDNDKDERRKTKILSFEIHFINIKRDPICFTQGKEDYDLDLATYKSKQEIQQEIDKLFDGAFFDKARTALDVFEHCNKKFGRKVRPCDLADAIGYYTGKRKAPRLVKGRNEMKRQTYWKEDVK